MKIGVLVVSAAALAGWTHNSVAYNSSDTTGHSNMSLENNQFVDARARSNTAFDQPRAEATPKPAGQKPNSPGQRASTAVAAIPKQICGLSADAPIKALAPEEISEILDKPSLKKGEYESTAQYQARIAPLLATVHQLDYTHTDNTDDVVVSVPVSPRKLNYNADTKQLFASDGSALETLFPIATTRMIDSMGYQLVHYIIASSTEEHAGGYKGLNAFGTNANVTRITERRLGLMVPGTSMGQWPYPEKNNLAYDMAPAEAEASKGEMSVLQKKKKIK